MICVSVPVQAQKAVYTILRDGPVIGPIMSESVGMGLSR